MDLVSIIVPIYNVEPFLQDCLVSICNQTYSDIEVLLIDDGSTDKSSSIALEFSKKDMRFKYLRKDNGGLSSARNFGIERANGAWLMFIDSDDLVSPCFVDHMVRLVTSTKTNLGVCLYERFKISSEICNESVAYLGQEKICSMFSIYKEIDTPKMMLAWNKIYKKALFDDVRYPNGKIHEDLGTTYKIFDKVKEFSLLDEKLYYYRINQNSISLSKVTNRKLDVIDFYYEQLLFYKKRFECSKEYKLFYKHASLRAFKIFGTLLAYKKDCYSDYPLFKKSVQLSYKQKFNDIIKSRIGFGRKLIMFLSCKRVFVLILIARIKRWLKG